MRNLKTTRGKNAFSRPPPPRKALKSLFVLLNAIGQPTSIQGFSLLNGLMWGICVK
jgi:hypothetical protein